MQFRFHNIGRVAACLTQSDLSVTPFPMENLLTVVQSFGGDCIYGWEFIDIPGCENLDWLQNLSLDWRSEKGETAHSISLFQGMTHPSLSLCIWFGALEIFDPTGKRIPLEDFIAGGKRWWDAFYAKDVRTEGVGMFPL